MSDREPSVIPEPEDIVKITRENGLWAKRIVVTTEFLGADKYSLTFADGTKLVTYQGNWGFGQKEDEKYLIFRLEIIKK